MEEKKKEEEDNSSKAATRDPIEFNYDLLVANAKVNEAQFTPIIS